MAPIQLAIRLLIPEGSRLLELPKVQQLVGEFDAAKLCYLWPHPDPRMDQLYADVLQIVKDGEASKESRRAIFRRVWKRSFDSEEVKPREFAAISNHLAARPIPHLSEPWYC